jgi:flagellar protein FliO/FliZ
MVQLKTILATALLLPTVLLAAEQGSEKTPTFTGSTISGGTLWETLLFLLLIVGLILGLGWLLRRMSNSTVGGKGMVTVLGGASLGSRERAVIIQAGDTRLLVGVAPGRVETLCILDSSTGEETVEGGARFARELKSAVEDGVK